MRTLSYIFTLAVLAILFNSCFKKDEKMVIIENKGDQDVKSLVVPGPYSIYTYNDYIDLDSGRIVKTAPLSSWDLGFEASSEGWHILVNSANSIEAARTGRTEFSNDYSGFHVTAWLFDASSGNPDSTAIGDWVSFNSGDTTYTKEVYLLGKNNGNGTYSLLKKISFIEMGNDHIKFITGSPESTTADTITIQKDPEFRYVHYSYSTPGVTVHAEPPADTWDLVAGSYRTTLYTDQGIATPYTVRGVLTNIPEVKVIKVIGADFFGASATDTTGSTFSNKQDAIGYDWKDYNSKDSNPYRIVPDLYYFIKTRSGQLVKLEFTGYTSANAEYGYPAFRYIKISK